MFQQHYDLHLQCKLTCGVAGIPVIGLALVENIEGTHYWAWKDSDLNQ